MIQTGHSIMGYPNTEEIWGKGTPMLGEMVCTMILMLIILLGTEKWHHKPEIKGHYALCIGFVVMSSVYAIGPITGAALNPARVLGPMIVSGAVQT